MAEVAVVTYNVHSCVGTDGHYSMDRIARLVQREHPDIVCFQEIEVTTTTTTTTTNNNTKNKNSNNTKQQQHEDDEEDEDDDEEEEQQQGHQTRMWSAKHFDNQPEYIAKMLRLDHVAFASAISSKVVVDDGSYIPYPYCRKELHNKPNNVGDTIGQFGVCILSRYPILETKRFKYTQYGSRTQKNTIACLVQIPSSNTTTNDDDDDDDETTTGTSVWIINTHLGSHPTGNEQFQQATELSKVIQSLIDDNDTTNPIPGIAGIILCGDFNSLPFFQSIQTLIDIGMKDVWKQKEDEGGGIGWGHTFPAPGGLVVPCTSIIPPLMRLDYLFTTSLKRYTIHTLSIHVVNQGTSIVATASNSDSDNSNSNDDGDSDKILIDIKASDHLALSAMFSIERNSI